MSTKDGAPLLSRAVTCGLIGVHGLMVDVEVLLSNGLVAFDVVGLPSAAVKESRERIRAAIQVSGYPWILRRMTVNLSPADIRKEGTSFELAIAVAMLAAEKPELFHGLDSTMLLGELSLEGRLMPIRGALGMTITASEHNIRSVILPRQNAREAACISSVEVYPADSLSQVVEHMTGKRPLKRQEAEPYDPEIGVHGRSYNMMHVTGQPMARRAIEVAAAGGHNLLMVGVPGSGKTMLARCMPGILPPLSYQEALEATLIHSAAGELEGNEGLLTQRPFRAPHHNISMQAMIGGGIKAGPGEVSLAHHGVLFLDELPEFQRQTLEALRQPLEDGYIHITRVASTARFQSSCMLLASMNPCPCGNHGSRVKVCRCGAYDIKRYLGRISGPLLDRIDMQVEMDAVSIEEIEKKEQGESTATVQERVGKARRRQLERYREEAYFCNAQLSQEGIEKYCQMDAQAKKLILQAVERFHISMRAYARIRKVSKTLADLAGRDQIQVQDIAQAIQFRNLEGQFWG